MPKNGWWTMEDVRFFAHEVHEVWHPAFLYDKSGTPIHPDKYKTLPEPEYSESESACLATYEIGSVSDLESLVSGAVVYMYGPEAEMFTRQDYGNAGPIPKLRACIKTPPSCPDCDGVGVIVICESPYETEECETCHGEGVLEE